MSATKKTNTNQHFAAQCLNIFPIGVLFSSQEVDLKEGKNNPRQATFGVYHVIQEDKDEKGVDYLRLSIITKLSVTIQGTHPEPVEVREFFYRAHHQGHFKILAKTKKARDQIKRSQYSVEDVWPYISMQFWYALQQAKENIFNMSGIDLDIVAVLPSPEQVEILSPSKDDE